MNEKSFLSLFSNIFKKAYEFIKSIDAEFGEAVFTICASHFPLSRYFHINLPIEDDVDSS